MENKNQAQVELAQPFDYIDKWKKLLQRKSSELAIKEADLKQKESLFKNANEWEQRLKQYWEALQKTNTLAQGVSVQIELFSAQADQICQNAKWLTDATEYLTGLLWETHYHTKQLQTQITDLNNLISCAGDTTLQSGVIWEAIKDMITKTNAAILLLEAAIKLMLQALRTVIMLRSGICRNDKDHNNKFKNLGENGLRGRLDELSKYFNWRKDDGDRLKLKCEPCDNPNYCTVKMPLENDSYYTNTKSQHDSAFKELADTKINFEKAQKEKDLLRAEKTRLENAIKAALEARKN